MHRGYVKVWRKMEDSGLLQDQGACQFFLWALFKATHKPRKQIIGNQVVNLEPGQFVSGRHAASEELGISPSKFVRTVEKMKNIEFVDTKPNNKFTVFTIVKWDTYQSSQTTSGQQSEQQANNSRTTSEQQSDTNKNVKNNKNEKNNTGYSLEFEAAWKVYPKKTNKGAALKAWNAAIKRGLPVDIMPQHIESRMYEPDWRKDDGKFIPHLSTWLNADGWLDDGAKIAVAAADPDADFWNVSFYHDAPDYMPKPGEVLS